MAIGNRCTTIIGKALKHRSPKATQIYSRLTHDPVRQAMEKAQFDILALPKLVQKSHTHLLFRQGYNTA